jgi:hypothetical protein
MNGPYSSEREARRDADHAGLTGTATVRNRDMLTRACWTSHIEAGLFDARIIDWLAGYKPATCAVIAGLVRRAYDAGQERRGGTR